MKANFSLYNFFRKVLLFCSPFILLLIIYIIADPFKVIFKYENYYSHKDYFIFKNRDYISSEMYLNNCNKYKYDSFIFGSSTSLFFHPSVWGKHINTDNRAFSFDASSENLVGIWSKIKYIYEHQGVIKNALVVFDTDCTFIPFKNTGHLFMKDYRIYPSSWLNFHYESFIIFVNIKFLIGYIHYKVTDHYYPYMKDIFEDRYYYSDPITNEMYFEGPVKEIKADSIKYYEIRKKMFFQRPAIPMEYKEQIDENKLIMLKEICDIFKTMHTDYRIVITPQYNQLIFNRKDIEKLHALFGMNNVFDFSGKNNYTEKESNYYDSNHFKAYVGSDMLDKMYEQNNIHTYQ